MAVGAAGQTYGFDIGKECIARAKRNGEKFTDQRQAAGAEALPSVLFAVADAWDTATLLQLAPALDMIFVFSSPRVAGC